jgi:NAD(P)-dependent dehydrogenase (short-subunit alcohol dehydrogenase family)
MDGQWKTIWITGASSGIGRQLALDLVDTGAIVAISARSGDELKSLAASHERIHDYPLDVTDLEACRSQAAAIEADLGPLDLVIPAAGVWLIRDVANFSAEDSARAMRVNYEGTVNIIDAVLPSMRNRRRGYIAPIASVAGYRGIPRGTGYAPTKAALISLAETLRTDAAQYGIAVSIINMGFVRTPMTEVNDFPMPFIVEVDEASRRIIDGLKSGRFEIVFPLRLMLIMKLMRLLPYRIYFLLIDRFVQHGPHGLGGNK